jgi:hypothetical protein
LLPCLLLLLLLELLPQVLLVVCGQLLLFWRQGC